MRLFPFIFISFIFVLSACVNAAVPQATEAIAIHPEQAPTPTSLAATQARSAEKLERTPASVQTATVQKPQIPEFEHILIVVFENRNYKAVIGNSKMPAINALAEKNVLLTNYYGVTHPSLPNYISLVGGNTFGIKSDCTDCWLDQPSLPDLLEGSGRSWKTYQEGLPSPCFVGSSGSYAQKHDPFIYFDSIRNNPDRCKRSIVSFDALGPDLEVNQLPNFAFIVPDMCHSAHDCDVDAADTWLDQLMNRLLGSTALGNKYLVVITFDESGNDNSSCCGLPAKAGGKVVTVLVSPQARSGFQDSTAYSHYSLLKTISLAWSLPILGFAGNQATQAILAPWQ